MKSKARRIMGWVLVIILSFIFVLSSIGKIFDFAQVSEMFVKWGLADMQILIGFGLLISTILFLIPITFSIGVLLLSAFWGGAIATHMINNESFIVSVMFLLAVWITAYIRVPYIFIKKY